MDAQTFKKENQIPNRLTMNVGIGEFNNLNGAISYDPDQKWYYLSNQTPRDVLIFHQYSKVPDSRNKSNLFMFYFLRESGLLILTQLLKTEIVLKTLSPEYLQS